MHDPDGSFYLSFASIELVSKLTKLTASAVVHLCRKYIMLTIPVRRGLFIVPILSFFLL